MNALANRIGQRRTRTIRGVLAGPLAFLLAGPALAPACDTRPASNERGGKSRSLSTG